jgi:mono/diheme cytochrome c family protein
MGPWHSQRQKLARGGRTREEVRVVAGFLRSSTDMAPTHHCSPAARLATVAMCLVVVVMGCARAPIVRTPPMDEMAEGRDLYLRRCASCHGVDGRGHGSVALSLRNAPPDLTRLAAVAGSFPRDRIVAVVSGEIAMSAHGTREMPVWSLRFGSPSGATAAAALWSSQQLDRLTNYLEVLQEP